MLQMPYALKAWNSASFQSVLKQEIEQLHPSRLPLQQALSQSSVVSNSPVKAVIINTTDEENLIHVKVGVFYQGVIAGCNCADDPTPIDELSEYCVLQFSIDKVTADTTVMIVAE